MIIGCTVGELGVRMGSAAFGLWLAFFEEEPSGPGVSLAQWAEMMAALHNGPLRKRNGKSLWKAADFAGSPWQPPPVKKAATAGDARALIKSLKAARG